MDSLGQLSLDRLRSFVAFAEHLNFTHAARSLNTSQPALHTQIRRLEDELGQRLYRREGRALVLTPAGKRALRSARAVTREAAALV
ncbi:MAG: LysR family transcriptional regulator, partial [Myxococcales bacterium]|nr:LysR family transcriptional regulator [Myxococcales bacterium]